MSAYIFDRNQITDLVNGALQYSRDLTWTVFPGEGIKCKTRRMEDGYSQDAPVPSDDTRWRRRRACRRSSADRIGQVLWDANIESVKARYPNVDDLPGPIGETFVYDHSTVTAPPPMTVYKLCDTFEYQSCEYQGWWTSEARAFLTALRAACVRALPGYADA